MRLIDADALKEHLSGRYMTELFPDWYQLPLDVREKFALYGRTIKQAILDAPTIDAEPVVRCKDCQNRCPNSGVSVQHCTLSGMQTEDDDFCSYGARKGENEEMPVLRDAYISPT